MKSFLLVPGGAAALVGGYSAMDHTPVYPVGIDQAYHRLHQTRFSDELGTVSMRKSAIVETVEGQAGKSLRWFLRVDGASLGVIEAQLTPDGASSTKVAVAFKATQSGPLRKLAQFVQDDGLLNAGLQELLDERVAASIEDRPFDENKVAEAIRWYTMTHPWELTSLQVKMEMLENDPETAKGLFGEAAEEARRREQRPVIRAGTPMASPEHQLREQHWETERKMREAAAPTTDVWRGESWR